MTMLTTLLAPESREKAAAGQVRLRERSGARVAEHPAHVKYYFGLSLEEKTLARLQIVGNVESPDKQQVDLLLNRIAEAYACQARYEEAAAATQSADHQTEYKKKAQAVGAIGSRQCDCPLVSIVPSKKDAKGERLENLQKIEEVFNGDRIISLSRCRLCGSYSAD